MIHTQIELVCAIKVLCSLKPCWKRVTNKSHIFRILWKQRTKIVSMFVQMDYDLTDLTKKMLQNVYLVEEVHSTNESIQMWPKNVKLWHVFDFTWNVVSVELYAYFAISLWFNSAGQQITIKYYIKLNCILYFELREAEERERATESRSR